MANIKELATSKSDVYRLNPRILKIKEGWNSRDFTLPENVQHIAELAASIAENGVRKPLEIFKEGEDFFVSDGECRLRATMKAIEDGAEIESVPVITEPKGSNEVDRLFLQHVGNSGKQFNTLEKGNLFHRLTLFGLDEAAIARRIGVSKQHVIDCLMLRSAPAGVQKMIRSGEVAPTLALQTLKSTKGDGKAATSQLREAVKEAKSGGKTKATARDVTQKGETFKQIVGRLVGSMKYLATSKPPSLPGVAQMVTVAMPLDVWTELAKIVKVKPTE
jgi:ParB family transcriptional regulator, chromosome partitioning protein